MDAELRSKITEIVTIIVAGLVASSFVITFFIALVSIINELYEDWRCRSGRVAYERDTDFEAAWHIINPTYTIDSDDLEEDLEEWTVANNDASGMSPRPSFSSELCFSTHSMRLNDVEDDRQSRPQRLARWQSDHIDIEELTSHSEYESIFDDSKDIVPD